MQRVLGFSPLETGLGFLPATIVIGAFSYSLTARIVGRVGVRTPFFVGAACGMLFMPLILAATASAAPGDAGIASGLVSTSQQLGGALGLAVLATVAESRTAVLRATRAPLTALTEGFQVAFVAGGVLAVPAAAG